ncbi:hypothetical protein H634G_03569 [Metarhizium anisopliae BRIP 53293]|uniref:Uncharacterized protein n=1 Tax=Metarhizium anisopliae BRIP 53293 TaxID=1291518 RepID=A0A0D9P4M8_METAN|nr:hypothetical protein H634G_03569 [Metarhizium anisopliae BRIP 53293]KJK86750.1 hypothetical protein H633G_09407 [Metarhizium anisopliae BRIP 53284]
MARNRYAVRRPKSTRKSTGSISSGIKKCNVDGPEIEGSGRSTPAITGTGCETTTDSGKSDSKINAAGSHARRATHTRAAQFRGSRSINEILALGLQHVFTKERQYLDYIKRAANVSCQPNQGESLTHVAGLQRLCGRVFGTGGDTEDCERTNGGEMDNGPLSTDEAEQSLGWLDDVVDARLAMRIPHVQSSSNRLQAVLQLKNPFWRSGSTKAALESVRAPKKLWQPTSHVSYRQWLQSSSSKYGCRRLSARVISFKTSKSPLPVDNLACLGNELDTIMTIDDDWGSIGIFETDIPHISGVIQSWTWIKITKPVFVVDDPDNPHVTSRPELTDSSGELSDSELLSLRLVLRYGKGGIPSFECSKKNADVVYPNSRHEFLTMGTLPPYDFYDDEGTGCFITPEFEKQCLRDNLMWKEVQAAMARSACIVEINSRPGEGWNNIAPSATTSLN